ncbi:MAG: B12-binding domain-containing radical SAM protein, partial [Desulfomonilaceae bacterium]
MNSIYKHALCLHPYYRDSHAGSLGLAVFPPIGLEYIMAALRPHVGEITFVDLRLSGPLRKLKNLERFVLEKIDLLCVSINWEYSFREVCDLINKLPSHVTTVVGGQQASDSVEDVFKLCPGVDIIVRGEGEETIAEIAKGIPLKDILGISYRARLQIIHNPNRPLGEIENYVCPDRSLRSKDYNLNLGGYAIPVESFDMILTSRGCPYNCKFCTFNLNPWTQKRRYSARSINAVMAELDQVKAGIVLIADENFFVNPDRAKEICNRLIAKGSNKRFLVQARIEIFQRPDVLEAAAKAGIKIFLLGIESP